MAHRGQAWGFLPAAAAAALLVLWIVLGVPDMLFLSGVFFAVAFVWIFAGDRFLRLWRTQPLFSTGMALVLMILLQTYALGFEFDSVGAWLLKWKDNWFNIMRNNAVVGIIALGMTLVILTGGIDLAVGSTLVGVDAVIMLMIDTSQAGLLARAGITGWPAYILGMLAGMLVGVLLGGVNGLAITKGRVPPFIATLGMMNIVRSVTQHFMQTYSPRIPFGFTAISNTPIFGDRVLPVVYWLALAAILYVLSKKTAFGRHIYAVGSNERATRLSGVNVAAVKWKVYALMGLIVSAASVVQLARIGSMDPANTGSGYELDAIAAVIVGGTSMQGGKGSIIGTVLGMLIIGVMNNLLNLLGVPPFLRAAFKGAIVVGAVLLQRKEKSV